MRILPMQSKAGAPGQVFYRADAAMERGEISELLGLLPLRSEKVAAEDVIFHRRNILFRLKLCGGRVVAVKQWHFCGLFAGVRMSLRGTKAQRSYEAAKLLRSLQVATPAPLMWWWRKSGAFRAEAAYVCAYLPGAVQLRSLQAAVATDERLSHLRAAGRLAGSLHEAGLMHHDFTPGNVLILPGRAKSWEYYLVDLNRLRRHKTVRARRGIKNLAQLEFSSIEDADVLVDSYCGERGLSSGELRQSYALYLKRRQRRVKWKKKTYRLRHPFARPG
jgi:hypothetical protein